MGLRHYNHDFSVVYTLDSDHPEGEDLTELDHYTAALLRINDLRNDQGFVEAAGFPVDTVENDGDWPEASEDLETTG